MNQLPANKNHLIIGANSAIAKALINHLKKQNTDNTIFTVSRSPLAKDHSSNQHYHFVSNYKEEDIKKVCETLKKNQFQPSNIYILNGKLHDSDTFPEKQIGSFDPVHFATIMNVNTITPLIWIKHLKARLPKDSKSVITCLSARVGSISDNQLGGWYSYRTSKAALNMLLKTASIELSRKFQRLKVVAYHPGTVDTPLSEPFQSQSKHTIFSPEQAASYLYENTRWDRLNNTFNYIDWKGSPIEF